MAEEGPNPRQDLDEDSEYFTGKMSADLREFGLDGQYLQVPNDRITKLGEKAQAVAVNQLEQWLYLDPYKFTRFVQSECPWSNMDQDKKDELTRDLVIRAQENRNDLIPLAQILIRISEHSRNRYATVESYKNQIQKWYSDNLNSRTDLDQWDLGNKNLNAIANDAISSLNKIGLGSDPMWKFMAKNMLAISQIATMIAMMQELIDQLKTSISGNKKILLSTLKLLKGAKGEKSNQFKSQSDCSEIPSPQPISPLASQKELIKSERSENYNNLSVITLNYYNKSMEGKDKKDNRVMLDPDKYQENFLRLAASQGFDQKMAQALGKILRECYTNPLMYLGPPKNLKDDFLPFSQPLTVSKESWKSKRIHSLEKRFCNRCCKRGHTEANCSSEIMCRNCWQEGHATTQCTNPKAEKPNNMIVEGDQKKGKSSSAGKRKNLNKSKK
jgi:hypothetical protein